MCGVFGTFGRKIDKELFRLCTDRLSHRGPDGGGEWYDDIVYLGHRRLSILDLSVKGKQPMPYWDDRYIITYNGEVYNYIELREELENIGYKFCSLTDTEVVLAAFCEWQEKCLNKFNGMFAFAIWDTKAKRLFIARDRLGVKPLYYIEKYRDKEYQMAFASEMKALLPLIEKPSYNEKLIRTKGNMLEYEGTETCIVNEVLRFPAGHYAWIDKKGIVVKRWWDTLDNLIEIPCQYKDQVEMFYELFLSACKIRMRSDVKIGTALSGGVDSSAVASVLARIILEDDCGDINKYRTFVATFKGTTIDEKKYAKSVAEFHNFNADYIDVDYSVLLDNISRDMYYFEDVYITPPCTMSKIYQEMKRAGVSVTIDGHGADELFCGYDMDVRAAFYDAGFDINKIRSIARTYIGLLPYNVMDNMSVWKIYRPWIKRWIKAFGRKNKIYKMQGTDCDIEWKKLDYLNQNLYLRVHKNVLPTLLRNYDRYSMMNGVEIRMPFLDYRILQFAFSIGWQSKIHNGYTKAIVRDAMKGKMPQNIIERKNKIGFSSPLLEWLRGPLKEPLFDMLSSQEFINCDLLDIAQTRKKMEYIIRNTKATQMDAEDVWIYLQPALWKKYYWDKCAVL